MTETFAHKALKEEAKKILLQKGMNKIEEEYTIKIEPNRIIRIDVVGFDNERKIGIECGTCTITKLKNMEKIFDEVIFLPFNFKRRKSRVRKKISFFLDAETCSEIKKLVKCKKFDNTQDFIRRAIYYYLQYDKKVS